MKDFLTAERRAWVYRVAASTVPLLITLGFLTDELAGIILNIAAAILGVGSSALALANLSPDKED